MTTPEHTRFLSRRATLTSLGLGGLALSLSRHLATLAQPASPEAEISRIDHPLNGVWEWNKDLGHNLPATPGIFYPDGAYLEFDIFNGLGLGFWRPTSEQAADAVVLYQLLVGSWAELAGPVELFEPDFVPAHPEFNQDFILRFHQDLRVNNAGDTLTGSGVWDVVDLASGDSVYAENISRHAKRMTTA